MKKRPHMGFTVTPPALQKIIDERILKPQGSIWGRVVMLGIGLVALAALGIAHYFFKSSPSDEERREISHN